MNPPEISVIMPVFNAERWLEESLGSIRRQGVDNLELIVVDDGSTDSSAATALRLWPEAVCIHQANQGAAAARNAGLARVRTPLVTFLDADDTWPDGSLGLRIRALAADAAAWMVLGRTRFVSEGPPVEPWVSPNLGAGLYRQALFARVGGFSSSYRMSEDVDWAMRVRESGLPYLTLTDITLNYRKGTGGLTSGQSWHDPELRQMVRASLARRRAAGGAARDLPLLSGSTDDPRASGKVTRAES